MAMRWALYSIGPYFYTSDTIRKTSLKLVPLLMCYHVVMAAFISSVGASKQQKL